MKIMKNWKGMRGNGSSGAIYGIAVLGAAVYYLQHATTFAEGVLGILKAILWPAVLILRVFELLRM